MSEPRPKRAPFFAQLLRKLPRGFVPLDCVVVIKCLDDQGNVCLFTHKSATLAPWEAYGMLCYACEDYTSAATYSTSDTENE